VAAPDTVSSVRRADVHSRAFVGFRVGRGAFGFSVRLGLVGVVSLVAALVGPGLVAASAATPAGHDPKPLTDMEQAKAVLLTQAEMPAGWVATGGGGGDKATHTAPVSGPIAECIGVSASVARVKPLRVSGPDFTTPDRSSAVEDSVSVYATTDQARAAYKALANPRMPSCMGMLDVAQLQTSIEAEAGPHATVDSLSISPLRAGAAASDQTGFTVTVPLTLEGKRLTVTSTQIDDEKGKVLQQLTFDGNGAPFTPLEQVHLLLILTGHP
jgi:hypothetical protein